jgi:hypothetical protein
MGVCLFLCVRTGYPLLYQKVNKKSDKSIKTPFRIKPTTRRLTKAGPVSAVSGGPSTLLDARSSPHAYDLPANPLVVEAPQYGDTHTARSSWPTPRSAQQATVRRPPTEVCIADRNAIAQQPDTPGGGVPGLEVSPGGLLQDRNVQGPLCNQLLQPLVLLLYLF